MSINTILVLIAMEKEARPFIDGLSLVEDKTVGLVPCKTFKGSVNNTVVIVVTNGIDVRHMIDNVDGCLHILSRIYCK